MKSRKKNIYHKSYHRTLPMLLRIVLSSLVLTANLTSLSSRAAFSLLPVNIRFPEVEKESGVMLRHCWRSGRLLCVAVVVPDAVQAVSKDKEAPLDRLRKVFSTDEYGDYSPELTNIYQTTVFAAFAGACYGGLIYSRNAYSDFIEKNEATKFKHHFEAKKALQNYVTVNFAKGAFKWSWRVCVFTGLYISFATALHAYRGEASVLNYVAAGLISGTLYRVNYGLPGMIVGGTLGAMIGLTGGVITINILRFTGHTLDDIYQIQEEQYSQRKRLIKEGLEKSSDDGRLSLLMDHDRIMKDMEK